MANGNPADVGYQPQGVPESIISGLINRRSKGAEGLNQFNQSNFFPALQQMTQQIAQANQKQKQQQALAGIMAQLQQNPGGAQQGPQMPTGPAIQGPQGYAPPNQGPNSSAVPAGQSPMPRNPSSGMGAAPQPFNGIDPKQLIQALGPNAVNQMIQQMMTPPTPMNPLQNSQIGLNQAKTNLLNRPPQQKMTNPLDDAIKQKRLEMMGLLMRKAQMQGQPKPPNPVPAAALDVRTQIANNQQAPWYKKMGFAGGLKPVTNPLKGQKVPASSTSDMSDEELMRLATQDDNQ